MTKVEEEFQGVLQNLEFALVQVYRAHDEMTDWETETAVASLIRTYNAEARRRKPPNLNLKPLAQEAYDNLQTMCEFRLGRTDMTNDSGETLDIPIEPISVNDLLICLKRIRRSIQMWHKEGGRRGYFDFVSQFLP
ncbi:MAG: hypothetical protein DHS20C20_17440 [Ardenticatenaceae bacterium]|nr:MAG: hypothetical protein DHS20C20_17440 [Ardenticatenaceae bacterium]